MRGDRNFKYVALKTKGRQFDNFVVISDTLSCHNDNLRRHQLRQSCQIDNILFSVKSWLSVTVLLSICCKITPTSLHMTSLTICKHGFRWWFGDGWVHVMVWSGFLYIYGTPWFLSLSFIAVAQIYAATNTSVHFTVAILKLFTLWVLKQIYLFEKIIHLSHKFRIILMSSKVWSPREDPLNWSNRHSRGITPWWRHRMETFSTSLALCAGNSPVTGEFRSQRPVMRSFDVFFAWANGWVNNRDAGDLRRHRAHDDVTVMRTR